MAYIYIRVPTHLRTRVCDTNGSRDEKRIATCRRRRYVAPL